MFSADTDSEKECCNTAYKAGQTLRKVVDIGAEDARDIQASIVRQVRTNPVQSTAIAAGVGLLLGLLLGRR